LLKRALTLTLSRGERGKVVEGEGRSALTLALSQRERGKEPSP